MLHLVSSLLNCLFEYPNFDFLLQSELYASVFCYPTETGEELLVCSGNQKNKYKWAKQLLKEVNTENKIGPTD